ncbi:sigma factor-like helix-turn-helix DNA-binding protein [Merdimonas faecis]|uniref:Sigma-70 family RNA polymerase sigma factor n=1 Tax=Merdimonas faecis TaxID=1653435 RepID=A0A9D2VWW4_9FIRM|nr:sigma factor-like helix-turn-helix DNA-binding protein [Merdimonas faecis]HJH49612.1 sigma-70 family RNA polymerase sigma factor [Merdimonas faecis]
MKRELLNRYKQNKRELALIDRQLDRLQGRLESVPEVSGKVTKSGDDFPYIEEHVTVRMAEPKTATAIKDRIREKETRQQELMSEIREVEEFISGLPEGMEKNILEMVYLENMSQRDAAEMTGYTQGRIAQIIKKSAKD